MPRVPRSYVDIRTGEILDAAILVFARAGFDGASMQEIAREADVSVGTLYRYFESKEALLRAVCDRDAGDRKRLFDDAVEQGGSPMRALTALGTALLLDDPDHIHMSIDAWLTAMRAGEDWANAAAQQRLDVLATLQGGVAAAQRAGEIAPDIDACGLAHVLMAVVDGLRLQQLHPDTRTDGAACLAILGHALHATTVAASAHPAPTENT